MKVRDFMITKVFTVKPSDTVKELLNVLTSNRIGGVPVVDNKGQLAGMVSDGDVLRYLAPKPLGFAGLVYIVEEGNFEDVLHEKLDTQVKEIMTKKISFLYHLMMTLKGQSVYYPGIITKSSLSLMALVV